MRLNFSNTRFLTINDCEWKDMQIAIKQGTSTYGCFSAEHCDAPNLALSAVVQRLEKIMEAAKSFPEHEKEFALEVLGALLNRVSDQDVDWAISVGKKAYPVAQQMKTAIGASI